jgi:hypothetical protein
VAQDVSPEFKPQYHKTKAKANLTDRLTFAELEQAQKDAKRQLPNFQDFAWNLSMEMRFRRTRDLQLKP